MVLFYFIYRAASSSFIPSVYVLRINNSTCPSTPMQYGCQNGVLVLLITGIARSVYTRGTLTKYHGIKGTLHYQGVGNDGALSRAC
jgi:hypothetical protein